MPSQTRYTKCAIVSPIEKNFWSSGQERQLRENIERDLKQTFRPEFLNRIDEIIIFHGLTQEHVRQIVDLQMKEIAGRLAEHGLKIELTDAARDWLADQNA